MKLVANSNITINIIQLCQTEYMYSLFLLMYLYLNKKFVYKNWWLYVTDTNQVALNVL